ncbi:MAG: endolytic transglycosylase MltG [Oscillospiraceae bacterium]
MADKDADLEKILELYKQKREQGSDLPAPPPAEPAEESAAETEALSGNEAEAAGEPAPEADLNERTMRFSPTAEQPPIEESDTGEVRIPDLKAHFGAKTDREKYSAVKKPPKRKPAKKALPRAEKPSGKKGAKPKKSAVNRSIFTGVIIAALIITISFGIALSGIKLGMEYLGISKSGSEMSFYVNSGMSTDEIADLLVDKNLISNKTMFKVIVRLKHAGGSFQPGDITLQANMSYSAMIDLLCKQRENRDTVSVTIKEGVDLYTVAQLLEEKDVCDASDFLYQFNRNFNFDFESEITPDSDRFYAMEGYCFPDTYNFYLNDTAENVVRTIRENFQSKFTDAMLDQAKQRGLTLEETMTLASMVELEAGKAADMPKVASVFLNRLDDPDHFPKLQSDATDNYVSEVIDKAADAATDTDLYKDVYDTYVCEGLPAGPVGNPGLDAINAVLNAPDTDYLYFCSNLSTKKTYFAKTLAQHTKNLAKAGLTDGEGN